jgi:serine phosphatase RsbU (regulator of sigma subunit)
MSLLFALAVGAIPLTPSELRWELAGVAIGFILAASSKSAAHLADALLLELRRWSSGDSGCAQDDDITLLVLEVQ